MPNGSKIVSLLTMFAISFPAGACAQKKGKVRVLSNPPGCSVSFEKIGKWESRPLGKTPKTVTLSPGKYLFTFAKKKFLTEEVEVTIKDGKTSTASVVLKNQLASTLIADNSILVAARKSYKSRTSFSIATPFNEFFPGSSNFYSDKTEDNPQFRTVAGTPKSFERFLSLSGSDVYPGDVVVVKRDNYKVVMVYAGEFQFKDSPGNFFSFFYYPYLKKSGLQLNTYPPRWDLHTLRKHKILASDSAAKSSTYTGGKDHSKAKFVTSGIDSHQVRFLKSPRISKSLFFTRKNLKATYSAFRFDSKFANPLANMSTLQSPGGSGWKGAIYGKHRNSGTRMHHGFDIYAPAGTSVFAVDDGSVELFQLSGYGKLSVLRSRSNPSLVFYYAHLSNRLKAGYYKKGQKIGATGTSGTASSTRPHLHFEIRKVGSSTSTLPPKENVIDPKTYYAIPTYVIEATGSKRKVIK